MRDKRRNRRPGALWIALGLVLIAAALLLTGYNLYEQRRAERSAAEVLNQLESTLPAARNTEQASAQSPDNVESPAEPAAAGETDAEGSLADGQIPDFVRFPDMEMPLETVNGRDYVGVLRIPVLGLELPVISRWSYSNLKIAPCRYSGSAYLDDLILCGHNYTSHFGDLKSLRPGDTLSFTDMGGNVFHYEVVELETLGPTATEELSAGDWDLTLFTCTVGGQSRVTVRCSRTGYSAN